MILGFFFFNDTATTEIYTLSLHDALPIWFELGGDELTEFGGVGTGGIHHHGAGDDVALVGGVFGEAGGDEIGMGQQVDVEGRADGPCRSHRQDRKSTRLNSSHTVISYAVF